MAVLDDLAVEVSMRRVVELWGAATAVCMQYEGDIAPTTCCEAMGKSISSDGYSPRLRHQTQAWLPGEK
jgi:hypothetical protein